MQYKLPDNIRHIVDKVAGDAIPYVMKTPDMGSYINVLVFVFGRTTRSYLARDDDVPFSQSKAYALLQLSEVLHVGNPIFVRDEICIPYYLRYTRKE